LFSIVETRKYWLEVTAVLQTLGSDESYGFRERPSPQQEQSIDVGFYVAVLKRRFLYLLGIFGLISTIGLYVAAILKPVYNPRKYRPIF
jgi:uncharacterized protein involved in exopolysaccharide biosynthesis